MTRWRLAILAIPLVIGALAPAAQKSIFSISAEEVRVDVLVTANGKPVTGMTTADFEILDNGVRQQIQYATLQKQMPVSAVLVFDLSRSVAGEMLGYLRSAAGKFLDDLRKEDHAALITFNNAVTLGSMPTQDFTAIKRALDRSIPMGNSSLMDASYAGLILAQTRSDPTLIILFSDGRDTHSWLTDAEVLETAKRNEAVVCAVSSRWILDKTLLSADSLFAAEERLPKKTFLNDLVQLTGGSLMNVESTADLAAAFRQVLDEFRCRYLITFEPRGVSESGWHTIEVRVKNRSAKVTARPGYMRSSRKK
jgi:VWFA-related protein